MAQDDNITARRAKHLIDEDVCLEVLIVISQPMMS
jgi:hypothetical protein